MIYKLYCLYDLVAGVFHAPSVFQSDELCKRDLRFLVNHDERLRSDASDYEVILVGTFDAESGIISFSEHKIVCRLIELVDDYVNESEVE